jgi:hypothetical protein
MLLGTTHLLLHNLRRNPMIGAVYTGFGIRVQFDGSTVQDSRVSGNAFHSASRRSMAEYARVAKNSAMKIGAGNGNDYVRLIPLNDEQNTAILMILLPFAGHPGVRSESLSDVIDHTRVIQLAKSPAPYTTNHIVRMPNGAVKDFPTHILHALRDDITHNGEVNVNKYARTFGFTDAAHMLQNISYEVPEEIVRFAHWLGLFTHQSAVTALRPMVVHAKATDFAVAA